MKEFIVMFNNGSWEDTVSFPTKASSKTEALENVLLEHTEYTFWNNFVL